MPIVTELSAVLALLSAARSIAVLGAHVEPARAACYVPDYLHAQGYVIHAVNPRFAGRPLWGRPCAASLSDVAAAIDLVDVFRRGPAIAAHVPEILAMSPLPRTVWFQLGIRNDDAAQALAAAGIHVVQDRCTLADHQRHRLPRAC
jgi:predicted CoA-binding protein